MTNFEFYKDDILKIAKTNHLYAFDKNTKRVIPCGGNSCKSCKFHRESECCEYDRMQWLYDEYNPPASLSIVEIEILNRFKSEGYMYIAKDKLNYVHAFEKKPYRVNSTWSCGLTSSVSFRLWWDDLFRFIQWEDKEPTNIETVLNNCKVVDDLD